MEPDLNKINHILNDALGFKGWNNCKADTINDMYKSIIEFRQMAKTADIWFEMDEMIFNTLRYMYPAFDKDFLTRLDNDLCDKLIHTNRFDIKTELELVQLSEQIKEAFSSIQDEFQTDK